MGSIQEVRKIREYGSEKFENLNKDVDIPYLKKECFNPHSEPYKIRRLEDEQVEIENTSYAGIIQLENTRIHFSTKVKTNLFYMLSFLRDEECFCYDPDTVIDIKEGANFFDVLGKMFLNELDVVSEKGFFKEYVRKEENIRFLKGKLNVNGQLSNHIKKRPRFRCSYEDLTYDNLKNQIMLRATSLLIPLIRFNDEIKKGLIRYRHMLGEEVSLLDIQPEQCDQLQYSKLDDYYEPLMKFSKLILQFCFIRSVHKGASKGFNFIVNMNKVYEDFVTQIVEEIVEEDETFGDLVVEAQSQFDSLVEERRIVTRPDVILRKKDTNEYPLIIDAKYKKQENNADYYQVIAYALAIPTSRACCLIYPMDEEIEETPVLTLDPERFGNQRGKIKLHTMKLDLALDEQLEFSEYVNKMKQQVKGHLHSCLNL